eukprot:TRINITY_DN27732_c0_g1_i2.p1 TRINITY_DN27732_c0_g1~~TRINITY_DN27732_c0_g1_i2.p1  ORF type:complete len:167 (-),score=11.90 TRINITY_DN27732_c0_g1_i2:59-559(-)
MKKIGTRLRAKIKFVPVPSAQAGPKPAKTRTNPQATYPILPQQPCCFTTQNQVMCATKKANAWIVHLALVLSSISSVSSPAVPPVHKMSTGSLFVCMVSETCGNRFQSVSFSQYSPQQTDPKNIAPPAAVLVSSTVEHKNDNLRESTADTAFLTLNETHWTRLELV